MRRLLAGCVLLLVAACTSSTGSPSRPSSGSSLPSSAGPASPAPATGYADWPMYHGNPAHDGRSGDMPAVTSARVARKLDLDGAVYASPIIVGGTVYVATEHDRVYAFSLDGTQRWQVKLGEPSPATERPCGDIDPLGITGTPIYSAETGDIYLVVEHGGAIRHELIALHAKDGTVDWRRSVDLPGANAQVMQQRGALAITGGRVWVSFGALAGDCGDYKGRVVGARLDGSGPLAQYDPSTRPQGGIWNPAGPTVDAAGHLLVVSANGSSFPGDAYDHTNSVDELDVNGRLIDSFAPSDWAENNQGDVGLGSQGVALLGTKWAVLGGKSGPVYVLRQGHLGGIAGQVSVRDICLSFGGAAVSGDTVYLPCTDGVRALRVDGTGRLHVLWHADSAVAGSPVLGGGRLWAADQPGGVLHVIDPATGKTTLRLDVGETSRFATPAIYGTRVFVPTLAGLAILTTS